MSIYNKFGKRALDLLLSVSAAVLFFPVILIVSIFIVFLDGTPVFFGQHRAGKNGNPFTLYKFRTMKNEGGDLDLPYDDSLRVTKLGQVLRVTSLDELPSLINILMGDMSIVGPRPLLMKYNMLYSEEHKKRLSVKPGLTGPAQIGGRNGIDWTERFRLDVQYIKHMSFTRDCMIILKTGYKVFKMEGTSKMGHSHQDEYTGS